MTASFVPPSLPTLADIIAQNPGYLDEVVDTTEAARVCGVKPNTVQQWRWDRKGPPYVKIGGSIRYRRRDLYEFIASQVTVPGA